MVTIKIKNKKVKVFNLLLLIIIFILFMYLVANIIFMLPLFKSEYNFNIEKENYNIKVNTIFKRKGLSCIVKEEYNLFTKDKYLNKIISDDLKKDGFNLKSNNKFVRKTKKLSFCKKVKTKYKKYHDSNDVLFKLKGNKIVKINYGDTYKEEYVEALIDKKEVKNITISSNLNVNKVGKYIVSYILDLDNDYKQVLYRIVSVIDKQPPIINLIGDKKIILEYGKNYKEPGFSAIDNYDGDITEKVKVRNGVNSKKSGTYKITYSVTDSNNNKNEVIREVVIKEKEKKVVKQEPVIEQKNGVTYVDGVLLVNKKYGLPKDYDPKVNKEALKALERMQMDAKVLGLDLSLISGYRSYEKQKELYNKYVKEDGEEKANTYSAKPGHSEHQTGLAFDIGGLDDSFKYTDEAKWIKQNAHLYGFIVRYPENKTKITGYIYEPWHVRYLGIDIASQVYNSGLCLEEYLGIN